MLNNQKGGPLISIVTVIKKGEMILIGYRYLFYTNHII